jgi:two-component system nitrogen regulation response regulator NtrX
VLITGPPGVGKEIVGRLIHASSRRADAPFVVINAATMAPERMEVELFGCEAGFLGPGRPRQLGTFERAHGGTLLLDEVADMPLETQGKILRVLQEQSFTRLGGQRRIQVDVRVIAASNRDLQAEIAAGRFREDLYYRLNVVPIRVPPLAERRADIPTLRSISWCGRPKPRACRCADCLPRLWLCSSRRSGRATCASCATFSSGC